jgi:hypothetical protein
MNGKFIKLGFAYGYYAAGAQIREKDALGI